MNRVLFHLPFKKKEEVVCNDPKEVRGKATQAEPGSSGSACTDSDISVGPLAEEGAGPQQIANLQSTSGVPAPALPPKWLDPECLDGCLSLRWKRERDAVIEAICRGKQDAYGVTFDADTAVEQANDLWRILRDMEQKLETTGNERDNWKAWGKVSEEELRAAGVEITADGRLVNRRAEAAERALGEIDKIIDAYLFTDEPTEGLMRKIYRIAKAAVTPVSQ